MVAYRPNLSPTRVHSNLKQSLCELRQAEHNAVLWFSEVMFRKLYRSAGCSSIQQYAEVKLGFGKSKTSQFIHLCGALETLPRLKKSVSTGEVSWTKAREIAKVATPKTETRWVAKAKQSTNRELEIKVNQAIRRARADRCRDRNQVLLGVAAPDLSRQTVTGALGLVLSTDHAIRQGIASPGGGRHPGDNPAPECLSNSAGLVNEVPVTLQVRLSPEQYACYESLMEKLRKQGHKGTREELLLAGLEAMVFSKVHAAAGDAESGDRKGSQKFTRGNPGSGDRSGSETFTRGNSGSGDRKRSHRTAHLNSASPYQVVVQLCENCGQGRVATSQGLKKLGVAALRTILCDSRVHKAGQRNRATIPLSVRRRTLARDRYQCRAPGCNRVSFLNVHHKIPRSAGGSNDPANLVTLCSGCHRTLHQLAGRPYGPLLIR